jgi:hypothetical protein
MYHSASGPCPRVASLQPRVFVRRGRSRRARSLPPPHLPRSRARWDLVGGVCGRRPPAFPGLRLAVTDSGSNYSVFRYLTAFSTAPLAAGARAKGGPVFRLAPGPEAGSGPKRAGLAGPPWCRPARGDPAKAQHFSRARRRYFRFGGSSGRRGASKR